MPARRSWTGFALTRIRTRVGTAVEARRNGGSENYDPERIGTATIAFGLQMMPRRQTMAALNGVAKLTAGPVLG